MDILRSRICLWTVRGAFPEISFSSPEFEFPELDRVLTLVVSSVVSTPTVSARSRRVDCLDVRSGWPGQARDTQQH